MVLSDEIRKVIGELDQKAGELIELIEDQYNDTNESDEDIDDTLEELQSLQNRITTIQENQGWI